MDELKKQVGYRAVDAHVRSGMVVGLGTVNPYARVTHHGFNGQSVWSNMMTTRFRSTHDCPSVGAKSPQP